MLVQRIHRTFDVEVREFRGRLESLILEQQLPEALDGAATTLPPRPSMMAPESSVSLYAHVGPRDAESGTVWVTVTIHSPADSYLTPDAWTEADAWALAVGGREWAVPEFHGEWQAAPSNWSATNYRYALRLLTA
ncbi:hypothetical protein V1639_11745 [Pseudarthrobacter sp. J75]|uniref:hypothetical protein n=1 Tax=unclassified Pseudarthrobacter TaxID=2647000 RepID=UPI002E80EC90|nr:MULTISPECIES: hypothetical protein [unclassified Pseudarthrobacter]MEE2523009.1 hypothetical protein [Pseudarthrobacter sp. J47]MEE2529692.1 hypothetical protein [Pseudarthrobacter sp. J75]